MTTLFEEYEIAMNELKAVEASEGMIPTHRFNALLNFASNRADKLLDQLYPEVATDAA